MLDYDPNILTRGKYVKFSRTSHKYKRTSFIATPNDRHYCGIVTVDNQIIIITDIYGNLITFLHFTNQISCYIHLILEQI